MPWPALACLMLAILILVALSVVDLRVRLLPNELVAALALTGLLFHLVTHWVYLSPHGAAAGAALGFALMYAIRFAAGFFYKEDALGLGDVKLIAAGGLWLGPGTLMLALAAGAFLALLHGLCVGVAVAVRHKRPLDLARLKVPAGPGFAAGLALGGALRFWPGL